MKRSLYSVVCHSGTLFPLAIILDFSNLWKYCCRFDSFMLLFTQCKGTWLTAISSHCLAALPAKISAFNSNPVTSLRHQEGRRFFWEGDKFFKLCPIVSKYVQHIFPGGGYFCDSWLKAKQIATSATCLCRLSEGDMSELQAAWHHNCELGSYAVWTSYWQINCLCKN